MKWNRHGYILKLILLFNITISLFSGCGTKTSDLISNSFETETYNEAPVYEYLSSEKGIIRYEDENVRSRFGIDISEVQKVVDWDELKKEGVEFAIIRITRRGYTVGDLYTDDCFEFNWEECNRVGIDPVGVYVYSSAITIDEAIADADKVLQTMEDFNLEKDTLIFYDLETDYGHRNYNLTAEEVSPIILAFCEKIENAGYTPGIYTDGRWKTQSLDLSLFDKYGIWFINWGTNHPSEEIPTLNRQSNYSFWQYSEKGKLAGTTIDYNLQFIAK